MSTVRMVDNDDNATESLLMMDDEEFYSAEGLSEAERVVLTEELLKCEDEIATLKRVMVAREAHAASLKRQLGIATSPLSALAEEVNKTLKVVTNTEAFQKTSEVVHKTSEATKGRWSDMMNSNLFRSVENRVGSAINSAKIVASTSFDHISGRASNV